MRRFVLALLLVAAGAPSAVYAQLGGGTDPTLQGGPTDRSGGSRSSYTDAEASAGGAAAGSALGMGSTSVPPVRIQTPPGSLDPGLTNPQAPGANGAVDPLTQRPQINRPPEPSRFERYVADVVGKPVPLFGAAFFERAPFRPGVSAPVSDDYLLGPGDEVLVRGWGAIDVDVRAIIDRNGAIAIPRVGTVQLAGVRAGDAERVVRSAVGRYYRNFELSVSMGRLKSVTVYVTGQARFPGTYTIPSLSTIVTAVLAAGGPSGSGAARNVQLRRDGKVVAEIDMYAFFAAGEKAADVKLRDGDVVHFPAAYGHVALVGEVDHPAIYELKGPGETLEQLLAVAGGLPVVANPRRALVERIDPQQTPPRSVEEFQLSASTPSPALRDGDIVTVMSAAPQFANAVTLRGNVDQTIRVPHRPGMRVTDLIPDREFLLSRQSFRRLNSSSQPVRGTDPWYDAQRRQREEKLDPLDPTKDATGLPVPDPEPRDVQRPPAQPQNADDRRRNRTDEPAESIYSARERLAARRDERTAERDERTVLAEETTRQRVQEIGNRLEPINFDYASVERYDRQGLRQRVITFNLGRALDDPSGADNVALEPGDIVTVFSQRDVRVPIDRRPTFVTIEGEVAQPGVYEVAPGETLAQLVERAGGLTRNAYLFGAEFYREDVRVRQQEGLERVLRRVEQESSAGNAAALASLGANETGLAQVRLQTQQEAQSQMISRLRGLRATGRVSLGLPPDAGDANMLPPIRLENLDRLVIPARPDFVFVYGAVNTESSFIWRNQSDVQTYLSQAGLNRWADKGQIFVIRADGSVASGNSGQNPLRGFRVMPGDNIVVPEKADKEPRWSKVTRGLRDWSQILAGFGLAVAALNSL